ncbi:MAG TPA: S1/P1 nuclease [Longimicrobiales bacterium]|nr:S1/P1 nuclease [Longimicrobiales bacterium]
MMRRLLTAMVLLVVLIPSSARAWGGDGHRIVCGIAWLRLTPEARTMVSRLLGNDEDKTFADACVWADEVRGQRPETSAYHYVNIPAGVAGMDLARDCGDPAKRCAPWAIVEYARILRAANSSEDARRDALRFIMHFVGDLHQPLHAGRPGDLGGNTVIVEFFGNAGTADRKLNLHSVWDSQILRRAGKVWPASSLVLNNEVTPEDVAEWQVFDPVGWANDSYRICEDFVYGRLPSNHKIYNSYYRPGLGYAEVQLQRAGVRLAFLLNELASGRALSGV